MFATYAYPSHLPPTTPSPESQHDNAAIFQQSGYDDCDPTGHRLPPCSIPQVIISDTHFPSSYQSDLSSFKPLRLRPTTEASSPPPFHYSAGRGTMNMNMASAGSVAAQPGFHTPLASYAAQMVIWLWYGRHHSSPPPSSHSPSSSSRSVSQDPFQLSHSPSASLNSLQVQPSAAFSAFVARMLQITMVSHSVTLVALLYIRRLKERNPEIIAQTGSEQRPFIASLILSNKYLDDNTYTNATWAELAGLTTAQINTMEAEFLRGIDYHLGVQHDEYLHWRNLLDGFILARQCETAPYRVGIPRAPTFSPRTALYTPAPSVVPASIAETAYRARSASPPRSPKYAYRTPYTFPPSPGAVHRKRSAANAFDNDMPSTTSIYEQMRLPARKATFGQAVTPGYTIQPSMPVSTRARPQTIHQDSGYSRSPSLSRGIARIPSGSGGRRGSAEQMYNAEADLRHPATGHAQIHEWSQQEEVVASDDWADYRALVAPYERPAHFQAVPPEHLMFYSLAAEAYPGQDGAPRKAILCYQDPGHPSSYAPLSAQPYHLQPSTSIQPYTQFDPGQVHPYSFPPHLAHASHEPEPAQFANAGPPGYTYNSHSSSWEDTANRRRTGSDEQFYAGFSTAPLVWKARSEWSSPMPGYEGWHSHALG